VDLTPSLLRYLVPQPRAYDDDSDSRRPGSAAAY
jgi:hypothetical protein